MTSTSKTPVMLWPLTLHYPIVRSHQPKVLSQVRQCCGLLIMFTNCSYCPTVCLNCRSSIGYSTITIWEGKRCAFIGWMLIVLRLTRVLLLSMKMRSPWIRAAFSLVVVGNRLMKDGCNFPIGGPCPWRPRERMQQASFGICCQCHSPLVLSAQP